LSSRVIESRPDFFTFGLIKGLTLNRRFVVILKLGLGIMVQILDTIAEIQERHDAVREIEKKLLELHQVFFLQLCQFQTFSPYSNWFIFVI